MRFELMTSSLPRRRSTPELRGRESLTNTKNWSGRRDSNSRPSAWKADALPTELHPPNEFRISDFGFRINSSEDFYVLNPQSEIRNSKFSWCRGQDSNLRKALACRVYSPVPLTTRPPLHTFQVPNGAGEGTRTPDPLITNQMLYQLSYAGPL